MKNFGGTMGYQKKTKGWWCKNHLEKYMKVDGKEYPNKLWKIKHV
jgi:hypothetical protein